MTYIENYKCILSIKIKTWKVNLNLNKKNCSAEQLWEFANRFKTIIYPTKDQEFYR